MIRKLILLVFLFAPAMTSLALDPNGCVRPPTQDMINYKDSYIPQEFYHESFRWEIADVAVLAITLTLAGFFSVKHQPKRRLTLLTLLALLYFGFLRGGCICPVGATTNFCMGLAAPELVGKLVAVLFLLPLVAAFFVGRVFCTSACPLGALQHLFARKRGYQIPARLNKVLNLIPFALLAATVWVALRGGMFLACKLDVYKLIFFTGYAWIDQIMDAIRGTLTEPRLLFIGDFFSWLAFASAILLGLFVPRPFCRFACPYSVLLGLFSKLGLRKRHIDPESCSNCTLCAGNCPVQAITFDDGMRNMKVSDFHCIQCGRCDETCKRKALKA